MRGQQGPDRRTAIKGIAAGLGALAIGCGGEDEGEVIPYDGPSVAVVGAGIAGVSTAWLLDGAYAVDLYEARDRLGGNVQTIDVEVGGAVVPIDLGAQHFHPRVYPTYMRLLERYGLGALDATDGTGAVEVPGSITMTDPRGEALFVAPRIPDRVWPLREDWNTAPVEAFRRYADAGRTFESSDPAWTVTVDEWLSTLDIEPAQRDGLILPWIAALNSGSIEQTRGFSARAAIIFMSRALGDGALEAASYFALERGMVEVMRQMLAETTTVATHLSRPVARIERSGERPVVVDERGEKRAYDAVVFASRPDAASMLLADDPAAEPARSVIGGVDLYDARLVFHRDAAFAHADPMYRSFLNAVVDGPTCEASMQLGLAMRPVDGAPVDVWKSWISHRDGPSDPIAEAVYRHVLYTPSTIRAGEQLGALQGGGGLYFAGGWTLPFDAQETGLLSAMAIAEQLAPESARLAAMRGQTG